MDIALPMASLPGMSPFALTFESNFVMKRNRFDTSAKLNTNISEASMCLVRKVLSHQDIFAKRSDAGSDRVRPGQGQRKEKGCC